MRLEKFFLLSLVLLGCSKDKDAEQNISQQQGTLTPLEGIIKNRVYFASQENLKKEIEKMNQDEIYFEKTMLDWYRKGFKPFTPVGDPDENPELISLLGLSGIADDDQEAEENPISDPVLAAFLDRNKEIVVADTLYHFTKNSIYYSYIKDSISLRDYLKTVNEQRLTQEEIVHIRNTEAGKKVVVNKVYRFIAPISKGERLTFPSLKQRQNKTSKISGRFYDDRSTNIANFAIARTDDYEIHHLIKTLPEIEGVDNWFLHRSFGTTKVGIQKFDNRHRVKMEYWDQNYVFYQSTGISVRNQTRRFRIWWASKANEIVLGIDYAYFKFKKPDAPIIPPITPNYNFRDEPIKYLYKGTIYYDKWENKVYSNLTAEPIKLPFFKFENEEILNITLPFNNNTYSLSTESLVNESNITQLYKIGYSFLEEHDSGKKRSFIVTRMLPSQYYELVLVNEHHQEENKNKLKRHFYTDWGFSIGTDISVFESNIATGAYSLKGNDEKLNIEELKIRFYGMAKRGSEWKGSYITIGG